MGFKLVAKGLGVALLPESICKLIGFDIVYFKNDPIDCARQFHGTCYGLAGCGEWIIEGIEESLGGGNR